MLALVYTAIYGSAFGQFSLLKCFVGDSDEQRQIQLNFGIIAITVFKL